MVKVDDLNESIETFGSIVERFDEIQEACKQIDIIIKKEEESIEEVKKVRDQQKEFLDIERGIELSIDRKIENAELVLKDKLELVGHDTVNRVSVELKDNTEIIKSEFLQRIAQTQVKINEVSQEINEASNSIITMLDAQINMIMSNHKQTRMIQILSAIGIVGIIILQILQFYR